MDVAMDATRLVPVEIWEDQIERPERVDEAIDRVQEGIRFLRRRLTNLRSLRKLSVSVYGEPGGEGG